MGELSFMDQIRGKVLKSKVIQEFDPELLSGKVVDPARANHNFTELAVACPRVWQRAAD